MGTYLDADGKYDAKKSIEYNIKYLDKFVKCAEENKIKIAIENGTQNEIWGAPPHIDELIKIVDYFNNKYQKEILDESNNIIERIDIFENEFLILKEKAYSEIIRDSYLFLEDSRISIKKYFGKYTGLYRAEVTFVSKEEESEYIKESWMGEELTSSPLAFDRDLSKLSNEEFKEELKKYLK